MDSVILFLLAAVILLPIVFLVGFTGCQYTPPRTSQDPPEPDPTIPPPSNLTATARGRTQIDLTWTDNASNSTQFRLTRGENGGPHVTIDANIPVAAPQPHVDTTGLVEGQSYEYQVFAVAGGAESLGSNLASATTLTWKPYFDQGPTATTGANRFGLEGRTIVVRISAIPGAPGGPQVRVTVRSALLATLHLNGVFISKAASSGDQFDSDSDLKPVLFQGQPNVQIAAGASVLSDEITYTLDNDNANPRDLIVAFNIGAEGAVRERPGVAGVKTFLKANAAQAGQTNRTPPYTEEADKVLVVEKIEVLA